MLRPDLVVGERCRVEPLDMKSDFVRTRMVMVENWEMVRVVWATWNGTKPFLGRTLGIVGDSSSERFVKVYLQ